MRYLLPLFATALLLTIGCSTTRAPEGYLTRYDLKEPEVEDFEVCISSRCSKTSHLSYTEDDWRVISAVFEPAPVNAEEERERLELVIGMMETIIGLKNGTIHDNMKNKKKVVKGPQLDCIAEAANTTVALFILQQEGLMRFHTVAYPAHRGFIQLRLTHNSASIIDKQTGEQYALDSWFYKGGEPAVCVPVKDWLAGYDPHKN